MYEKGLANERYRCGWSIVPRAPIGIRASSMASLRPQNERRRFGATLLARFASPLLAMTTLPTTQRPKLSPRGFVRSDLTVSYVEVRLELTDSMLLCSISMPPSRRIKARASRQSLLCAAGRRWQHKARAKCHRRYTTCGFCSSSG